MRGSLRSAFIMIILVFSIVVVLDLQTDLVGKAKGETLFVGGAGDGNYTTIQEAINEAQVGDTVFVFSGTYEDDIEIDKTINVVGESRDSTHIEGENSIVVIDISANFVNIS
jgi:hypothetical protein